MYASYTIKLYKKCKHVKCLNGFKFLRVIFLPTAVPLYPGRLLTLREESLSSGFEVSATGSTRTNFGPDVIGLLFGPTKIIKLNVSPNK